MKTGDPRKKRERRRREEIRLSILAAAEGVITRKGFTDMTMDDVAREAGLSKATIYKYIPGKGLILFEIVGHYLDEVQKAVADILEIDSPAREKLRRVIREIVRFHGEKRNIARILMMDRTIFKFLHLIYHEGTNRAGNANRKSLNLMRSKSMDIIRSGTRIIEEGMSSGEFRQVNPLETVAFVASLIEGLVHNQLWCQKIFDFKEDELAEKIYVFIYSSIKKQAGDFQGDKT